MERLIQFDDKFGLWGIRKRLLAYMDYAVYFPIWSFLFHSLQQANHFFYGAKLIQLLCFFIFFEWHDYSAVNFPKQRCGLSSVSGCLILLPFCQWFRHPVFQAVPEIVPIAKSNMIKDDQKKGWGLKRRPNFSAKREVTRGSPLPLFGNGMLFNRFSYGEISGLT